MEAKPIENKIDILKLNIELRLNKYIPENEIKNKIINNMFNDISKINDLKYEYMKKINILNKKEDELISQLNNIKKDKDMNIKCLREYEMNETKEMITILKISNLLELNFNKSESVSGKELDDILFDLYYKDIKKPEWMNDNTKRIIDDKRRFNNEIIDYVEYITFDEKINTKRNKTTEILKDCIGKAGKKWNVFLFGSIVQGISTIFSDLDFELILDGEKIDNENEKLILIENAIKKKFNTIIIHAKVPIIQAKCYETNIQLDISVDRKLGYDDSNIIKEIISKHTILKQVIIILKIFLSVKKLNNTKEGGIISFLLFHLVYYYLRNKMKDQEEIEIVEFLIEFLDFYSNFEYKKYALLVSQNEVKKINKKEYNNELSVLSYLHEKEINQFKIDTEHNIGSKCKIFGIIKLSFAEFHTHIIHL